MDLIEKNQDLTPFKLCLCILLYEGLSNSRITSADRGKILNFIIRHVQKSEGSEMPYSSLLSSLDDLAVDSLTDSPKAILESKLLAMIEFSDVLQLFIIKLNELKSDGEISSGCLEQGGILYLFLRKCFVNFARMGFEDLVKLHKNLEEYKTHKPMQQNSKILASEIASSLQALVLNESYADLSQKIAGLSTNSKHLLQGHLDAYYHKNMAIDNIHRYFDLVLDQQMPTKTTREKGLVVVQSSTHFASLHRVKIELELGHLEAAVHLLVETIKRALSENDNLVILESTLLFMRIAGMMGNFKQEKRISHKAVLHALKIENINALKQTTLMYSQLHLLYPNINSEHILNEIQPKTDPKAKPTVPVVKKMVLDKSISTWCNLCDYTLLQALLVNEHQGLHKNFKFINVMSWLNQGWDWNFNLNFKSITEDFEYTIAEVNFYLELARMISMHDKPRALEILRFIDGKCKEKKCVKWEYTLFFIAHGKSLQNGEFTEAEHFEDAAEKVGGDIGEIKLLKLERFALQKRLKEGFELGNELILHFSEKGFTSKICLARLYLSQVYLASGEYFRALSELNLCSAPISDLNFLEIPVKLAIVEASLLAFDSVLISVNLLNSIENKIHNRSSPYHMGKYYKCRAKVALVLAQGVNDPADGEIYKKALGYLEMAEEECLKDNTLWEIREVHYMQARLFAMIGDHNARDFYSDKFCGVTKELNVNSKSTYKKEKGITLDILSE